MFILYTIASTSLLRMRQQLSSHMQQSAASPNNPDTSSSTYEAIDNENPAIYSCPDKTSIDPSSNTDMYACIPVVENSLQQTNVLSDTTDMAPTNHEVPCTQGLEDSTYAKPSPGTFSGSYSNNNCDYKDPLEQGGTAPSSTCFITQWDPRSGRKRQVRGITSQAIHLFLLLMFHQ